MSFGKDTYDLSDIELFCLGKVSFGEQPAFLQKLKGSAAFGTRLLSKPRKFVLREIPEERREDLSRIDDQQLQELLNSTVELDMKLDELVNEANYVAPEREVFNKFKSRDNIITKRLDFSFLCWLVIFWSVSRKGHCFV